MASVKTACSGLFFLIEFILLFSHAPFYSFYSNYLSQAGFSTSIIGLLWSVGVIAEIIMFAYATFFLSRWSWRTLVMACLLLTGLRWIVVGLVPDSFIAQFLPRPFMPLVLAYSM